MGEFGSVGTPGAVLKTECKTDDIGLRQNFKLGDLWAINRDDLKLYIYHDDEYEVYIIGVKPATIGNYTGNYSLLEISEASKNALKPHAANVLAIHCKQHTGGQFIDAGLSVITKK